MKPTRKLSRRSFLGRVAGGAIAGGAALTVLGGPAEAFQVTDSDTGPNADPVGRGRGGRSCSDSDTGRNADPGGRGRRCGGGRTGITDSDQIRHSTSTHPRHAQGFGPSVSSLTSSPLPAWVRRRGQKLTGSVLPLSVRS